MTATVAIASYPVNPPMVYSYITITNYIFDISYAFIFNSCLARHWSVCCLYM